MKLKHILIAALLAAPLMANGQSRSLPILEIYPDARAAGMGGNQYGESKTMLTYTNPTSLLYEKAKWNVSATTQIYPKSEDDVGRLMFYGASVSRRFGVHGIHAGFRYLGGYDIPVDEGKNLKPADWTVDLAYSIRFLDHFSASVGASLVHSKVVQEANTVAFNVAAYYRNTFNMGVDADYVVGINAANMGPNLDYGKGYKQSKLPANYGAGGEVGMNFNEAHRLNISFAAQYYYFPTNADMFTGNIGAEYTFLDMVSVRGGYSYAQHDYCHASMGAGVALGNIHLDAAFLLGLGGNDVNQTMISLGINF